MARKPVNSFSDRLAGCGDSSGRYRAGALLTLIGRRRRSRSPRRCRATKSWLPLTPAVIPTSGLRLWLDWRHPAPPPPVTGRSEPSARCCSSPSIMGRELIASRCRPAFQSPKPRTCCGCTRRPSRCSGAGIEQTVDKALLGGKLQTPLGWEVRGRIHAQPTDLMNWPMQSAGADAMRIAAIAATEAGIVVHAPVHDAFLIGAPLERLARDTEHTAAIMVAAGQTVTGGLTIRVEADEV